MTRHTRDRQLRKLGITSNHCNVPITVSCYLEIARGKLDYTFNWYDYNKPSTPEQRGFKNYYKIALERYE
ncbi:hypothetical protein [Bacillus thuringiensis]|uniref:hypothetical protein n=1 Tax=Bacillus thuringiensis TaxID=1428 RepID=UPI000A383CA3|nr:hypothetical protein [Bacillus thuringiensis]OTZ47954.1 hypothetical protein BK762_19925 [Bacillus thuringiensis serovar toumanoffi]